MWRAEIYNIRAYAVPSAKEMTMKTAEIRLSTIKYLLRKKFAKCRLCDELARYIELDDNRFLCSEHVLDFENSERLTFANVIDELEDAVAGDDE